MCKLIETNKQLKSLVEDSLTKSPKDVVEHINKFEDKRNEEEVNGINDLIKAGIFAILAGVAFGINIKTFLPEILKIMVASLFTAIAIVKGVTGGIDLINVAQIDSFVKVVKDYIEQYYPAFFKDIKSNNGKIKTLKQSNE